MSLPTSPSLRRYTGQVLGGAYRLQSRRLAEWLFRDATDQPLIARRLFGGTAMLDISRTSVQRQLVVQGERFLPERHLLRRLLRPGMRVIDVGANIGYYGLLFRESIGSTGHLWCFEPEPSNIRELQATIDCNAWQNVTLVRAAVGDRMGVAHLATGINGSVIPDGGVEVPMVTLDAAVPGGADFVKIDVEGFELNVLRGARALLERHRPTLFIEVHPFPGFLPGPDSVDELLDILHSLGRRAEFFECPSQSLVGTVAAEYLSRDPTRRVRDVPALLRSCREYLRTSTFWMICR